MKRYRVFGFHFDSTAAMLDEPRAEWEPTVRDLHEKNRREILEHLRRKYGADGFDAKLQNIRDLGPLPFSIIGFHNSLLDQAREAFVVGAYYPALTAVCALGERILNQLFLLLRDDFKGTLGYELFGERKSISNWPQLIAVLKSWRALLPDVAEMFLKLEGLRHRAVHYTPDVEKNARPMALDAFGCMHKIVTSQFGVMQRRPWILGCIAGEMYVKLEAEKDPFVRRIFVPNCVYVGPWHRVEVTPDHRFVFRDHGEYPERTVSDEEFCAIRKSFNDGGQRVPTSAAPNVTSAGEGQSSDSHQSGST